MYVPVAVRSSVNKLDKRKGIAVPMLIGSIEIDEWTTVEEARWIIARDLDKVWLLSMCLTCSCHHNCVIQVSLPRGFRFEFQGVPCARRQEPRRRIIDCMPFQPTPNNLLTEFSIASWEARKLAAIAAAEKDPEKAVKVPTQDDKWAIFVLPVPRPPRGTFGVYQALYI